MKLVFWTIFLFLCAIVLWLAFNYYFVTLFYYWLAVGLALTMKELIKGVK